MSKDENFTIYFVSTIISMLLTSGVFIVIMTINFFAVVISDLVQNFFVVFFVSAVVMVVGFYLTLKFYSLIWADIHWFLHKKLMYKRDKK